MTTSALVMSVKSSSWVSALSRRVERALGGFHDLHVPRRLVPIQAGDRRLGLHHLAIIRALEHPAVQLRQQPALGAADGGDGQCVDLAEHGLVGAQSPSAAGPAG